MTDLRVLINAARGTEAWTLDDLYPSLVLANGGTIIAEFADKADAALIVALRNTADATQDVVDAARACACNAPDTNLGCALARYDALTKDTA